jgi:tetratricopeptide (TPR) repeat protein
VVSGLEIGRVAEILVTLGPGVPGRRGSGYRVGTHTVLTAAHVVAGASRVRVRFDADQLGEWSADVADTLEAPEIDVALLTISVPDEADGADAAEVSPARFGRIGERDAVINCSAAGFPLWKLRKDAGAGELYRDVAHVVGSVPVLANRREGTFEITVAPPERDPDPEASPWQGMSGAAVFCNDRIVGIISKHHRSDGLGRLAASRADVWQRRVDPAQQQAMNARFGNWPWLCELDDVIAPPKVPDGAEHAPELAGRAMLRAPTGRLPQHVRGRDELLGRLEALLDRPDARVHVVAGLGGTGKSTIALRLAEAAAERGMPTWWVPALDVETVTAKLLELAEELGAAPGEAAQARAGQRSPADLLWRHLGKHPAWLLIFDNADDPDALATGGEDAASGAGWLRPVPAGTRGLVVVTSRNRDARTWGRHAEVHPVGWLDPPVGGQVLADLAPHAGSVAEAAALSDRLGGLPLALHHAGSQLGSEFATESTFAGYMRALNERFARLMGGEPTSGDRAIVTSTWELSLDALAARGRPQARPLLRVLGCLAPAVVIPNPMLDRAVLARVCEDDRERAADGLRALSSVGLIMTSQGPDGITAGVTVHPLVSETSRLYLDAEDPAQAAGTAVSLLDASAKRLDTDRSTDWPAWAQLVPHLNAVYDHVADKLPDAYFITLTEVAADTAMAFYMGGAYAASGELAWSALHRDSGRLSADHPVAFKLRSLVACARRFLGRPDLAQQEYREILADETRILGPDHPDTLTTWDDMATALARCGGEHQEQAQREYRAVLDRRTRVLGPDHPDTLTTRHESARTLAEQGQYAQAERELRDILERRTRVLGPEHQGTLTTRLIIAFTLSAQGQLAEAEREYRDILNTWPRVLGPDHPDTLETWYGLAQTIAAQGHREQARQAFGELLKACIRVQGPDHSLTRGVQRYLDHLAPTSGFNP